MAITDAMQYMQYKVRDIGGGMYAGKMAELDARCFDFPWSQSSFKGEADNPDAYYLLVFTDDEELVGYGGFWLVGEQAYITNIAVDPIFRRRRIATRILLGLINLAKEKDATSMTLEVRQSNVGAIALYEKLGFRSAGIRPGFYPVKGKNKQRESALIMWNDNFWDTFNNQNVRDIKPFVIYKDKNPETGTMLQ